MSVREQDPDRGTATRVEQLLTDVVALVLDGAEVTGLPVQGRLEELGVDPARALDLARSVHHVRREHARLRRRELELTALFSSARELAEVRDADALLVRLVERAHTMMGADLTYLSEFDPRTGQLQVRTTAGVVSPQFRELRVPAGAGLASVVVRTRAPQSVLRYEEYAEGTHDPAVDTAVRAEGVVSILGVPLVSGPDVLGVLFVATRTEHAFGPEQVALLSALASHAAVVLQTARTLHDLAASEDEARGALASLRGYLAERERSSAVHRDLVQTVLAGGGLEPVAATLAAELRCGVWIVDEHGSVVAGTPGAEPGPAARAALADSRRSGRCLRVEGDPAVQAVSALVAGAAGARDFGAVLLGPGDLELSDVDLRTVERATQVCALLALQQQAVADAERRVADELVAELLAAGPGRRPEVERRARRAGIPVDDLGAVVVLAVPGGSRAVAARAVARTVEGPVLAGEHLGVVVALLPAAAADPALVRTLHDRVRAAVGGPVLAVLPPPGPDLAAAFEEGRRTARLLTALGVQDLATTTEEYLPYASVLDTGPGALQAFLASTLGAVRAHDVERGTDLLATLRAFVRCGASPTRTARELNFHTNTILQRLARLDVVLGPGWREDERLFRLTIAVRLDELRERLTARPT
ncbi:helix-turn-helix domain-containing protein [Kineococcus sp. SYSU DK002]|uniref:helix-turn-helix domain-containing protein n=1 Tax=Kineococcus sp. SYSU DK002 TaxID=3383123 RepID=UPI003D7E357C